MDLTGHDGTQGWESSRDRDRGRDRRKKNRGRNSRGRLCRWGSQAGGVVSAAAIGTGSCLCATHSELSFLQGTGYYTTGLWTGNQYVWQGQWVSSSSSSCYHCQPEGAGGSVAEVLTFRSALAGSQFISMADKGRHPSGYWYDEGRLFSCLVYCKQGWNLQAKKHLLDLIH